MVTKFGLRAVRLNTGSVIPRRYGRLVNRDELQRRSVQAGIKDICIARVGFDDTAGWLAAVGDHPADPLAVEVWVFDPALIRVLLVHHRWQIGRASCREGGETAGGDM